MASATETTYSSNACNVSDKPLNEIINEIYDEKGVDGLNFDEFLLKYSEVSRKTNAFEKLADFNTGELIAQKYQPLNSSFPMSDSNCILQMKSLLWRNCQLLCENNNNDYNNKKDTTKTSEKTSGEDNSNNNKNNTVQIKQKQQKLESEFAYKKDISSDIFLRFLLDLLKDSNEILRIKGYDLVKEFFSKVQVGSMSHFKESLVDEAITIFIGIIRNDKINQVNRLDVATSLISLVMAKNDINLISRVLKSISSFKFLTNYPNILKGEYSNYLPLEVFKFKSDYHYKFNSDDIQEQQIVDLNLLNTIYSMTYDDGFIYVHCNLGLLKFKLTLDMEFKLCANKLNYHINPSIIGKNEEKEEYDEEDDEERGDNKFEKSWIFVIDEQIYFRSLDMDPGIISVLNKHTLEESFMVIEGELNPLGSTHPYTMFQDYELKQIGILELSLGSIKPKLRYIKLINNNNNNEEEEKDNNNNNNNITNESIIKQISSENIDLFNDLQSIETVNLKLKNQENLNLSSLSNIKSVFPSEMGGIFYQTTTNDLFLIGSNGFIESNNNIPKYFKLPSDGEIKLIEFVDPDIYVLDNDGCLYVLSSKGVFNKIEIEGSHVLVDIKASLTKLHCLSDKGIIVSIDRLETSTQKIIEDSADSKIKITKIYPTTKSLMYLTIDNEVYTDSTFTTLKEQCTTTIDKVPITFDKFSNSFSGFSTSILIVDNDISKSTTSPLVFIRGDNSFGQLGLGNYQDSKDESNYRELKDLPFSITESTLFIPGLTFTLALTNDFKLYYTGNIKSLKPVNQFTLFNQPSIINYKTERILQVKVTEFGFVILKQKLPQLYYRKHFSEIQCFSSSKYLGVILPISMTTTTTTTTMMMAMVKEEPKKNQYLLFNKSTLSFICSNNVTLPYGSFYLSKNLSFSFDIKLSDLQINILENQESSNLPFHPLHCFVTNQTNSQITSLLILIQSLYQQQDINGDNGGLRLLPSLNSNYYKTLNRVQFESDVTLGKKSFPSEHMTTFLKVDKPILIHSIVFPKGIKEFTPTIQVYGSDGLSLNLEPKTTTHLYHLDTSIVLSPNIQYQFLVVCQDSQVTFHPLPNVKVCGVEFDFSNINKTSQTTNIIGFEFSCLNQLPQLINSSSVVTNNNSKLTLDGFSYLFDTLTTTSRQFQNVFEICGSSGDGGHDNEGQILKLKEQKQIISDIISKVSILLSNNIDLFQDVISEDDDNNNNKSSQLLKEFTQFIHQFFTNKLIFNGKESSGKDKEQISIIESIQKLFTSFKYIYKPNELKISSIPLLFKLVDGNINSNIVKEDLPGIKYLLAIMINSFKNYLSSISVDKARLILKESYDEDAFTKEGVDHNLAIFYDNVANILFTLNAESELMNGKHGKDKDDGGINSNTKESIQDVLIRISSYQSLNDDGDNDDANAGLLIDNYKLESSKLLQWYLTSFIHVDSPMVKVKNSKLFTVERFGSSNSCWSYSGQNVDGISFTCDKDIYVRGIGVYGDKGKYSCQASYAFGRNGGDFTSNPMVDRQWANKTAHHIEEICWTKEVFLKRGQPMTVFIKFKGGTTSSGSRGKSTVVAHDCKFTFSEGTIRMDNGTSVSSGQIPSILFSLEKSTGATKKSRINQQLLSKAIDPINLILNLSQQTLMNLLVTINNNQIMVKNLIKSLRTDSFFQKVLPLSIDLLINSKVNNSGGNANGNSEESEVNKLLMPLFETVAKLNTCFKQYLSNIDLINNNNNMQLIRIESSHPYEETVKQVQSISFNESTKWMVIQFDSRSMTGQKSDKLLIYTDDSMEPQHLLREKGFYKKFPSGSFLVAGNKLVFDFQTATSLPNIPPASKFGYACNIYGYDILSDQSLSLSSTTTQFPLHTIENQLSFYIATLSTKLLLNNQNASVTSKLKSPLIHKKVDSFLAKAKKEKKEQKEKEKKVDSSSDEDLEDEDDLINDDSSSSSEEEEEDDNNINNIEKDEKELLDSDEKKKKKADDDDKDDDKDDESDKSSSESEHDDDESDEDEIVKVRRHENEKNKKKEMKLKEKKKELKAEKELKKLIKDSNKLENPIDDFIVVEKDENDEADDEGEGSSSSSISSIKANKDESDSTTPSSKSTTAATKSNNPELYKNQLYFQRIWDRIQDSVDVDQNKTFTFKPEEDSGSSSSSSLSTDSKFESKDFIDGKENTVGGDLAKLLSTIGLPIIKSTILSTTVNDKSKKKDNKDDADDKGKKHGKKDGNKDAAVKDGDDKDKEKDKDKSKLQLRYELLQDKFPLEKDQFIFGAPTTPVIATPSSETSETSTPPPKISTSKKPKAYKCTSIVDLDDGDDIISDDFDDRDVASSSSSPATAVKSPSKLTTVTTTPDGYKLISKKLALKRINQITERKKFIKKILTNRSKEFKKEVVVEDDSNSDYSEDSSSSSEEEKEKSDSDLEILSDVSSDEEVETEKDEKEGNDGDEKETKDDELIVTKSDVTTLEVDQNDTNKESTNVETFEFDQDVKHGKKPMSSKADTIVTPPIIVERKELPKEIVSAFAKQKDYSITSRKIYLELIRINNLSNEFIQIIENAQSVSDLLYLDLFQPFLLLWRKIQGKLNSWADSQDVEISFGNIFGDDDDNDGKEEEEEEVSFDKLNYYLNLLSHLTPHIEPTTSTSSITPIQPTTTSSSISLRKSLSINEDENSADRSIKYSFEEFMNPNNINQSQMGSQFIKKQPSQQQINIDQVPSPLTTQQPSVVTTTTTKSITAKSLLNNLVNSNATIGLLTLLNSKFLPIEFYSFMKKRKESSDPNLVSGEKITALNSITNLIQRAVSPSALENTIWILASSLHSKQASKETLPDGWQGKVAQNPITTCQINDSGKKDFTDSFHTLLETLSEKIKNGNYSDSIVLNSLFCFSIFLLPEDIKFVQNSEIFPMISKILSQMHSTTSYSDNLNTSYLNSSQKGPIKNLKTATSPMVMASPKGKEKLIETPIPVEDISSGNLNSSLKDTATSTTTASTASTITNATNSRVIKSTTYMNVANKLGIVLSKNPEMMASLFDETTNSFWEAPSNSSITITCEPVRSIQQVSVFIDNGAVANTVLRINWKSEDSYGNSLMGKLELDRIASWFTIPFNGKSLKNVQLSFIGIESIRVRQLKVLVNDPEKDDITLKNYQISKFDSTISLLKLLTFQIFGISNENKKISKNLKGHIQNLLSVSGVSSIQKQIFSLISSEVQKEINHFISSINDQQQESGNEKIKEINDSDNDESSEVSSSTLDDNYLCELLTTLQTLFESEEGKSFIPSKAMIYSLLSIIYRGTDKTQQLCISICKLMIVNIKPSIFDEFLLNHESKLLKGSTFAQFLLTCIAKSISVQVKSNGSLQTTEFKFDNSTQLVKGIEGTINLENSQELIQLVKSLIIKSSSWKEYLQTWIKNLLTIKIKKEFSTQSSSSLLISSHILWLSLSCLLVIADDDEFIKLLNINQSEAEIKTCQNHDDGVTEAFYHCASCSMNLCNECDRFLHLSKKSRDHIRSNLDNESFTVEVRESCVRMKVSSNLVVVDKEKLKAIVQSVNNNSADLCRYCKSKLDSHNLLPYDGIVGVCSSAECKLKASQSCTKIKPCGHNCYGIRNEDECLTCLHGCVDSNAITTSTKKKLTQDVDDMCMICWTESLVESPSIQLECGHVFHHECTKKLLETRWGSTSRITFGFTSCPICKQSIKHISLKPITDEIEHIRSEIIRKGKLRIDYHNLTNDPLLLPGGRYENRPDEYVLDQFSYYLCFKCKQPYFGGINQCAAAVDAPVNLNPEELICGGCSSDDSPQSICPKHGKDFLEYKCRYCCSVAIWFCFGTTHFCEMCHQNNGALTAKKKFPACPVGPGCIELPKGECPLGLKKHAETGREEALGCGVCRNVKDF